MPSETRRPGDSGQRAAQNERSSLRWLVRAGEGLLALAIVFLFFLGFLEILSLSFPRGTGLKELVAGDGFGSRTAERGIDWREALDEEYDAGPVIARLEHVRRTVKDRQAGTVSWVDSRVGMQLIERHGVQTLAGSSAAIQFVPGEMLVLGENSLVILRGVKGRRSTPRRRASVVLLGGQIRGGTGASSIPVDVELQTPSGTGRVRSLNGRAARYKVTVNPDQSSTYAVYDGQIAVTNVGRTVVVPKDHAVTVAPSKPPPQPVRLPDVPRLTESAAAGTFYFRDLPPRLAFNWDPSDRAEGYRLEIARDEAFTELVYERRLDKPGFEYGRLEEGGYFWRVSALEGYAESAPSEARRLDLIHDDEPPLLAVDLEEGPPVAQDRLLVRGTVEPGARIYYRNQNIPVAEAGEFEIGLELSPGPNAIVIEAVDRAGNTSYFSRTIEAKF